METNTHYLFETDGPVDGYVAVAEKIGATISVIPEGSDLMIGRGKGLTANVQKGKIGINVELPMGVTNQDFDEEVIRQGVNQ